jgi:CBS domain-containing protein
MSRATIPAPPALVLAARTAEELMVPNPISLRDDATVPEAVALMTDRGFSAAPVIDEAGHPVGVLRGVRDRGAKGSPSRSPIRRWCATS